MKSGHKYMRYYMVHIIEFYFFCVLSWDYELTERRTRAEEADARTS